MKRIIALFMVLVIAAAMFVACGDTTPTEKDYNLAIGVVATENLAKSKVAETVATIVTDADGKIVLCRIDCVEYTATYGENGALSTAAPTSKVVLGDNYTMGKGSWAKQTASLESYVVGKTQAEVAKIALEGGKPTDTELSATCTFDISDLLKAIDKAFSSAHKVSFKATADTFTAGLSVIGAVKDSSADEVKNATYTATYSATVMTEGKIVAAILDCAEVQLKGITEEGAASVDYKGTKREQGDDYAMTSGAWYVQADAYAKIAVGKTSADIAGLATEGVAGCTMPYSTADFKAGLEAAAKAAR